MSANLSDRCLRRLDLAHPDLRLVAVLAAKKLQLRGLKMLVLETLRSAERQRELYAQGRTKPGKIVTWTMQSRHLAGPDGKSRALDVAIVNNSGEIDWNDRSSFIVLGKAMLGASAELGIPVRWGYDWDGDGVLNERGEYDGPHFELLASRYP